MSALTSFLSSASKNAFAVIGNEPLTVNGGTAVNAVMNDTRNTREFAEIGMDTDIRLIASSDDRIGMRPIPNPACITSAS